MPDLHDRFRGMLAAHVADLLPDEDAVWMATHARECAACAALQERIRSRLPGLADDGDHAPVSLLVRWVRAPERIPALERGLLERHLAACVTCREDAEEMTRLAGVRRMPAPRAIFLRRWRGPLAAGLVAAAALTVVFAVRLADWARPGRPDTKAPPTRGEMMPAVPEGRAVVLLDHAQNTPLPGISVAGANAGLRLRVPPLDFGTDPEVLARILAEDGSTVWEASLSASALQQDIVPAMPPVGWSAGIYRLRLIPAAGRDTAATREFVFRLR